MQRLLSLGEDIHPVVRTVLDLLEIACRVVPGSADGLYHLAKAKFLAGDRTSAQSSVTKCLKLDNTYAKVRLLPLEFSIIFSDTFPCHL